MTFMKTKIIAEIGINHNGSLTLAKKLVDLAAVAGCDYVKFQKRNPDVCVPEDQKMKMRETPWGTMTYLDYKYRIEFGEQEYDEISKHCENRGIKWFASVWDEDSVDFMVNYTDVMKIPSALITDTKLCEYTRKHCKTMLVSTGMSTEEEVEQCIRGCNPDVIFHTNSTYPSPVSELNLNYIHRLKSHYPDKEVGYSGHEYGLVTSIATVAMGASWIERHVTLDRTLWGSDQSASVEPSGLLKLVKGIRELESSLGTDGPRVLLAGETKKRKSLRK
ncbi:MAG: N-acetylneuraminate synthase family protein [Planctomycetota bacterium]|nr:N-acetylneuraminate synthase family protein [Planctomycetota bacterium]